VDARSGLAERAARRAREAARDRDRDPSHARNPSGSETDW
jgi:hypothetical protein